MYDYFFTNSYKRFISLGKQLLASLGVGITSYSNLIHLKSRGRGNLSKDIEFLLALDAETRDRAVKLMEFSKSQLRQDLFVLSIHQFKTNGFFVEFGATNGVDLNNTFLLEKEFGWTGILVEPAKLWRKELMRNRPNSSIDYRCVWSDSNQILLFSQTLDPELSTISNLSNSDFHQVARKKKKQYKVQSISLYDLLQDHQAPRVIDYLSVDTEGSEFEILKVFDFSYYDIKVISVEHNFSASREKLKELLLSQGYERKFENISEFDDWYVKK